MERCLSCWMQSLVRRQMKSLYYVVAVFPFATTALPDTISFESQEFREFEKQNYEKYLGEQVGLLDALPSDKFEPDLMILDQIVGPLEILPP